MAEAIVAVKFCTQVTVSSLTNRIKNHPQNGCGYGHVTYLILCPPHDIPGTAKARDFKFYILIRKVAV